MNNKAHISCVLSFIQLAREFVHLSAGTHRVSDVLQAH